MNIQSVKGFRDFLPKEKLIRDQVAAKLRQVFALSNFLPLETPTVEYGELLLGKYGVEADKLVYTFSDRGDRLLGLRYDQTVPAARVLSQYGDQLPQFFRRYQMQSVFRAEKPQKGRYREFTQVDADIFGTTNLLADAEVLAVFYKALSSIGFADIRILVNDRQTLLSNFERFATDVVDVFSIIQSVDKLDKITPAMVADELQKKGLSIDSSNKVLESIETSTRSLSLEKIMNTAISLGIPEESLVYTPGLARGLDYYTGMIFEAKSTSYTGGSLAGGGRYDKLISQIGGKDVPAVGGAIGFDRLVDAAVDLNLFTGIEKTKTYLVMPLGESQVAYASEVAARLRSRGMIVEIYMEPIAKISRQFQYANRIECQYAVLIGEQEREDKTITIKDLSTGVQQTLTWENLESLV